MQSSPGQKNEMALAVSPGVLFVFCYLLNASFADAHSNGLDISVCANFEVTHGGVSAESTKTVQIELLQNGAPVNCFQRQKEYDSELKAVFTSVCLMQEPMQR